MKNNDSKIKMNRIKLNDDLLDIIDGHHWSPENLAWEIYKNLMMNRNLYKINDVSKLEYIFSKSLHIRINKILTTKKMTALTQS